MNKKRILIKILLIIIWMIIIFLFSNQPNSSASTKIVIGQVITTATKTPINNNHINIINFFIRKLAHITEYFILAILVINLIKEYTNKYKYIFIFTLFICFIYAITDEIHQAFVFNRTSSIYDAFIDVIGVLIYLLIYKLTRKKVR
ncbi:MAG: VanZ family protein [bacterium]|nr:VanZ family protein [bacterium]